MPLRVRESLTDDAIGGELGRRGERRSRLRKLEPRPGAEATTFERRPEIAVLQFRRPQSVRDATDVGDRGSQLGTTLVDRRRRRCAVQVPGRVQVQCRAGQERTETVVQIPVEHHALLLAHHGCLRPRRAQLDEQAASRTSLSSGSPTAASLAVQSGANVKTIQRMLGHTSAAMTLDVYSDLFDDDLDDVAAALDRAAHASAAAPTQPQFPIGGGLGL